MMQEGVIIGIMKTKQSYQAERSVERKACWIARFCSDILKIDKRNRLVRGQNVPCHSKCFQTTMILKYSYLQTIQKPRKQEQSNAKHNRFLFWICWYSLYSATVYLYSMKMNSISKKQNILTSLFIAIILFIRLQITDSKSKGQGYVIMNRQDGRA